MKTKRKLWTSIASLALVFVLAGTVVGVTLAALTGNVTSGFTINYTALNVSAGIFGSWGYSENSMTKMTSSGDDKILFTGSETGAQANKSFDDLGEIKLSNENRSVTFKFKFLNFDKNGKDYPLTFTLDGDMDNLNVDYAITTFDGEETDTKNGSETNLPLSVTSSIPYSGFSSYEAYEAASDIDDEMAVLIPLARVLFTDGVDALQEAMDRYYLESDADFDSDSYLLTFAMLSVILFPMNGYRIYLETGSEEEALKFIDELDLVSFMRLEYFYGENAEGLGSVYKYIIKDALMQVIFQESIQQQGYYVSDLDSLVSWYMDRVGFDPPDSFSAFQQKLFIWNIYEKFITEGSVSAIQYLEELYGYHPNFFREALADGGYGDDYYEDLKSDLETWSAMGDEGITAARAAQQELELYFEQYIGDGNASMRKMIQQALSDSEEYAPYTEIVVTISLAETASDAYLNSGSFEFVLGKQN